MQIKATTTLGEIRIVAVDDTRRRFSWDQCKCTAEIDMWKRPERWHATRGFGLYFPGPGRNFPMCGSVCRIVAQEGRQYFSSLEDAEVWLSNQAMIYSGSVACNSRGLVVVWNKVVEREQLNVNIWQIIIDGHMPSSITSGDESSIDVSYSPLEVVSKNRVSAGEQRAE
jgi:hypothetical protein